MKKGLMFLVTTITLLALMGYSNAGEVSAALDKAKKEGRAVMLELGSVGCIPCEKMKSVMERLRIDYKEKLEVFFVDVREDRDMARRFGVYAIPTQVFLDGRGKEFHRHIGFYGYEEIVPVLKRAGI